MTNTKRGRRGIIKDERTSVLIEPVDLPLLEDLAPNLINPSDNREDVSEDDRKFTAAAQKLWTALMTHPTTQVITDAQGMWLFAALCAYDSGLKGKTTSLVEARRIMDGFGVTPEAIAKRRIDLVAAADAEDRRNSRKTLNSTQSTSQAAIPSFRPTDISEGK